MNKQHKNILDLYNLKNDKMTQKQYNDEIVRKTMEYQKKFGFELNPRKGHELWNVEGDAFKHAFMSADLALKLGNFASTVAGIDHENKTPNNPKGEWNMDSWNNHQGRQIANEIRKEYGNKFNTLSQKERDAIIATKIMLRMQNGDLITNPNDTREYSGILENIIKKLKDSQNPTGQAAPIEPHIFTAQEIGKMTPEEFAENESQIMAQMKDGLIINEYPSFDYDNYKNPLSGNPFVFTREDIDKMTTVEYSKLENEILAQMKSIGIPSKHEIPTKTKTYSSQNTKQSNTSSSSNSGNGRWVTINGNHVFIEK